jgi:LPXTG-motif cell wall-anchored protein
MPVRLATLFATCLLLALPAAALGQGAGDDQYSDPFGNEQTEEEAPDGGEAPAAPEESAPAAPEPTPAPQSERAPAAEEQLPYTGADTGLLALGGMLLLGGGVALRVRLGGQP